jgi:hypothetical protein
MIDARRTDEGGRIYEETVEVKQYSPDPGHPGVTPP